MMPTGQTISDVLPKTQIIATAGQVLFTTNWTAATDTDIVVYARASTDPVSDKLQLIDSSLYNVSFVGAGEIVTVTFLSGRALNDVITIIRDTPADRLNLYSNTNFVPAMLNQDTAILTLVDQQAQLIDKRLAPKFNNSVTLTNESLPEIDLILPLLLANQAWKKNPGNTAMEPFTVPDGGFSPSSATYILQTPNVLLPNAQSLNALASGFTFVTTATGVLGSRVFEGTLNQLNVANSDGLLGNPVFSIADNPTLPGVEYFFPPLGTTAQRPLVPVKGMVRFNNDNSALEVYTGVDWDQLAGGIIDSIIGTVNQVIVDNTDPMNPVLSTPQDIAASSSPTFANLMLSNGSIFDANGNIALHLTGVASAVNYLNIQNSTLGNIPVLSSQGIDLDIPIIIAPKGDAGVAIYTAAVGTTPFQIYSGTSHQHLTNFTFANTANSRNVTFQDSDGTLAYLSDIPTTIAIGNVTGLGSGIATALAVNIGSAGAPILFDGAGGTPSSMTGTNITGTASGLSVGFATSAGSASTASSVALGGITGLGASVSTALATAVGVAGGIVAFNGAAGTPSSLTLTNALGLPIAGITGLGTNVATALAANLNGSGALSATTSPTFVTPILGVAAATSINFGGGALSSYVPKTSWTPAVTCTTPGDLSVSYAVQNGTYTRIGDMVLYSGSLVCTATFTTGSGDISITGLGVTSGSGTFIGSMLSIFGITYPTGTTQINPAVQGTTSTMKIWASGTAVAGSYLTMASIVTGVQFSIRFSGSYFV